MRRGCAVVILGLAVLSTACERNREQLEIRKVLEEVRIACEAKDFPRALSHITDGYSDNVGIRKENLLEQLNRLFSVYSALEIPWTIKKSLITGTNASVLIKLKVTGVDRDRRELLFGYPFGPSTMEIYLEKRENRWMIVGSNVHRYRQ